MNVASILRGKGSDVVSVRPTATLQEVASSLARHRIGAVVVTDNDGGIAGIVSERDIIKAIGERGAGCLAEPVSAAMTSSVQTCDAADTLDELMARMTTGRFRHLPVIEDGKLSGIVSIGDVVKHHVAAVELEASALRGYIVAG
jgi:CBS domain-containing protein